MKLPKWVGPLFLMNDIPSETFLYTIIKVRAYLATTFLHNKCIKWIYLIIAKRTIIIFDGEIRILGKYLFRKINPKVSKFNFIVKTYTNFLFIASFIFIKYS